MGKWRETAKGVARSMSDEFWKGVGHTVGTASVTFIGGLAIFCVLKGCRPDAGGMPEAQRGRDLIFTGVRSVESPSDDIRLSQRDQGHSIFSALERIAARLESMPPEAKAAVAPPQIAIGPLLGVGTGTLVIPVHVQGQGAKTQYVVDTETHHCQGKSFDIQIKSFKEPEFKEVRISSQNNAGSDTKTATIRRIEDWKPFHIDRWGGNVVWNKHKDWLGKRYYVTVAKDFYIWTRDINREEGTVEVAVGDSPKRWEQDNRYSLKEGDSLIPKLNEDYRIKLLAIAPAGRDRIIQPFAAWYEIYERDWSYSLEIGARASETVTASGD